MDTTGALIIIALATMQQEIGISKHIPFPQFDKYEYLRTLFAAISN